MRYSREQTLKLRREQEQTINDMRSVRRKLLYEVESTLRTDKAKTYLRHGVGRRIATLERCSEQIFALFAPDRAEPLPHEEVEDVKIYLQAHTINVIGLLDNWARVFVLEAGAQIRQVRIGLFKQETQDVLPPNLVEYLNKGVIANWHNTYANDYRDALAHRIPLYVPPAAYTKEENEAWLEADQALRQAIVQRDSDEIERLEGVKERIGRPALTFIHAFGEAHEHLLHPQLICDAMTIIELSDVCMDELLRPAARR